METTPYAHRPERPVWRCTACGDDWPCETRRAELRHESGGQVVSLALMMAMYFVEAFQYHPKVSPAQFHERFLGWIHRPEGRRPRR
jgi:hypothetical protein